jgi:hypothetical protein
LIPKIIHQLWIDPSKGNSEKKTIAEPPPDIELRCSKWALLHPSFTYRLWSLEDVLEAIEHDDALGVRALLAMQSLRFPAAKADIARLILLRSSGGFWVDLKLEPRVSFLDPLVDFDLVLTEHFPQYHRPEPNGCASDILVCRRRSLCRIYAPGHRIARREGLANALTIIGLRTRGDTVC